MPEFSGSQGASNLGLVEQASAAIFPSEESQKFLTLTGLANHPAICKDLLQYGMKNREAPVVRGDSSGKAKSEAMAYMKSVGITPV